MIGRGPGTLADHEAPKVKWGGRKAQAYTALTLETYGRVCWLCGLPGATTADHIIPIDKGGAVYDLQNLGPAHGKCNFARGNRDAEGPAAVIENGMAFFRPEPAETHAQPLPFLPTTSKKKQIRTEMSEK